MGVEIGEAHWAYSGFARFRERLAKHEGFDLRTMAGFTKDGKQWDDTTTDLRPLLDHSDCDGELTLAECTQVAPRLAAILDEWDTGDVLDYDIESGRLLVRSMQDAIANDEPLEFT